MIDWSERAAVTRNDAAELVIRCLLRSDGGPSLPSVISLPKLLRASSEVLKRFQRPANPSPQ